MESPIVERYNEQLEDKKSFNATKEEQEQWNRIADAIVNARNQREMQRDEFDGMSFEQVYLLNKRAGFSFLAPKKNDDEVRINTGTTEKRIELVQNELLALNFSEEIQAFDKDDNEMVAVSDILTDIVKRTEEMEHADEKDIYIINELLTQPIVYVEELWCEKRVRDRASKKKKYKTVKYCERRMLQGVQIYLGDVSIPDIYFNSQPYICKYDRMTYEQAETIFGDWDRWKYVSKGAYSSYFPLNKKLYRTGSILANEVEIWTYMSYQDDEVQVFINGVPMLEVGASYTELYGDLGGYHITGVGLKPYGGDFAYGKPLTMGAKTLQALDNETIRNLVMKFRQSIRPPVGIPAGKIFTKDIWNAGSMVQGVKGEDFSKLVDHQGVTQSEFAMFDLIEKKINEFIGTAQTQPLQGKSKVTATEIREAQKQAIKMIGLAVLAVMRLKDRLAMLRVKNALYNYSKPIGKKLDPIENKVKDVFARFSIDETELSDGRMGKRVIQVMDGALNQDQKNQLFSMEEQAKLNGENIEYATIDLPKLSKLDAYFYVNVVARERESSDLDKAMFMDKLNQASVVSQMTGIPLNQNKVVEDFEKVWKTKDIFQKETPNSIGGGMALGQGLSPQGGALNTPQSDIGSQMMAGQQPQKPSINNLLENI